MSMTNGQAYFWSPEKLVYVNRETVMKRVTFELKYAYLVEL
jgi:hypothetical protein